MKITVAGAGAGKTTNLAKRIIKRQIEDKNKIIYCVSFTNNSVSTIEKKLREHYGDVLPQNIRVSTIHSFLYQEIISPYNYYIYGKHYTDITSINLTGKCRFRNYRISQLRNQGIIHVEKFSEEAKFIICGKSKDKVKIKEKRKNVLEIIKSYFGTIFVDEAQDIDKHFLSILKTLNEFGIKVELIGDHKQDLRSRGMFTELIKEVPSKVEYNQYSYRCPQEHLDLSNLYVCTKEQQISKSSKDGVLNFYFEEDINDLNEFIEKNNYDLKYIYQKSGSFDTNKKNTNSDLYEKLINLYEKIESESNLTGQKRVCISKITYEMEKKVRVDNVTPRDILQLVFKNVQIDPSDYKDLESTLSSIKGYKKSSKIYVDSIERIKGQGKNNCLFIITPALVPYFLQESCSEKMVSHLYVGLTRSKHKLDILFTKEIKPKEREKLENYIKIIRNAT